MAPIESAFKEENSLYKSSRSEIITASAVKNSLLLLHFKILISMEESFLIELLLQKSGNDERHMARGKDQIKLHLQKLKFIPLNLSDKRIMDKEDAFKAFVPIAVLFRRLKNYVLHRASTSIESVTYSTLYAESVTTSTRSSSSGCSSMSNSETF